MGKHGFRNLQVIVGETGWPSAGIEHTSEDVSCWYTNSIATIAKNSTPASKSFGLPAPIIYIFQWIDEMGKYDFLGRPEDPGPIEDHFGVLDTSAKPKYPLNLESGHAPCGALPAFAYDGFAGLPHRSRQRSEQH